MDFRGEKELIHRAPARSASGLGTEWRVAVTVTACGPAAQIAAHLELKRASDRPSPWSCRPGAAGRLGVAVTVAQAASSQRAGRMSESLAWRESHDDDSDHPSHDHNLSPQLRSRSL